MMDYNEFKKEYNVQANPQQEAAIRSIEGPALLLAVPGSGKTTVIVGRTGYMVKAAGIPPCNILTLTFTVAAAREMKARYMDKFNGGVMDKWPHFSTIHSFCLKTIKSCSGRHGLELPELVPDNGKIVRQALYALTREWPSDADIRCASQQITYIKNMMLRDAAAIRRDLDGDAAEMFGEYRKIMAEKKLMDFDDQLIYAHKFLNEYPDTLKDAQNVYKYINVDEAQDTSLIQHEIIRMLASETRNIFMVGDEDQSIYRFRGAFPKALLDFEETYPGAKVIYMDNNYRSTKNIIKPAARFIAQNKDRHPKSMSTGNAEGAEVIRTAVPDYSGQHSFLYDRLVRGDGTVAVLYRNNESAIPLIDMLDRNGAAFRCRGDLKMFFTHFAVTDVMAFLKLAADPSDMDSFSKIYYKMGAYLSKDILAYAGTAIKENPGADILETLISLPFMRGRQLSRIREIKYALREAARKKPYDAIGHILDWAGYSEWIDRMIDEGNSETGIMQKLDTLRAVALGCADVPGYIKRIGELAAYRNPEYEQEPRITLSTMHSAKGLEFDKVFIIDAFEGLFPASGALKQLKCGDYAEYEEEVRLFYVGCTRARKELEFIVAGKRFGIDAAESMFIKQFMEGTGFLSYARKEPLAAGKAAPAPVPGLSPGNKVRHARIGDGFVSKVEGDAVSIVFGDNDVRTFGLEACFRKGLIEVI